MTLFTSLSTWLQHKIRYVRNGKSVVCLESLHDEYTLAVHYIMLIHEQKDGHFKHHITPDFQVDDVFLLKL